MWVSWKALEKLIKIDSPFHNITNELDDGLFPKEDATIEKLW